MFKPFNYDRTLFNPDFYKYILETSKTYNQVKEGNKVSFITFKQAPWFQFGRYALESSQLIQRSPYMDNDLVKLIYQGSNDVIHTDDTSLRFIADLNPELRKIITDRGVGGRSNYIFNSFIRLYYEFFFKMEYYSNNGMPKFLSKFNEIISLSPAEKWERCTSKLRAVPRWLAAARPRVRHR